MDGRYYEENKKEFFKPDYIVDEDKEPFLSMLRGEVSPLYYGNYRRYTYKDEYYRKFLEIISEN